MECDVAVVGAGPAGSSCAYRLARAGYVVTIIERSTFPRTKVCGEYLSVASRAELTEIGIGQAIGAEAASVRRIRVHTQGQVVDLPFRETAWSLARADLDALLLAHALGAGATCIFGRVERVLRDDEGVRVHFRDASGVEDTLHARIIVGADGSGSVVARELGLCAPERGEKRFALGGHYAGFGGLDQTIEMYVRGRSYFAINPLGDDLANVMVIVEEKMLHSWRGEIDTHLQETARELGLGARSVDGVRLVGKRVAIGPLSHRVKRPAMQGVYLIGDAAGFLDPFTGQGVFLALKSAALAARAIASESAGAHKIYVKEHRRLFARRQRVAALVSFLGKNARIGGRRRAQSAPECALARAPHASHHRCRMIQTRNEVFMEAPSERIFALANATDRWPQMLPHYRYVRTLQDDGASRVLEMSAMRNFIPVRWTAQQWSDPARPSIRFRHLAGWTRGMDVEWRFEPQAGGTLVSIVHDLDFAFPIGADFLGKHVVSNFFVHDIAGKTLRRIKELAEHA